MVVAIGKSKTYTKMSASGLVFSGAGQLAGIIIGSSSSLTLKLWDNNAASGAVLLDTTGAFTAPTFLDCLNVGFTNGLFVTIGGSGTFTVVWHPE